MNSLNAKLAQFTGTEKYYSFAPLTHLKFTSGAKYLHDVTPLVMDVAIAITFESKLRKEPFLSITITSDGENCKTIVDDGDGGEPLYTQEYLGTELPQGEWSLFATGGVLMLTSEY